MLLKTKIFFIFLLILTGSAVYLSIYQTKLEQQYFSYLELSNQIKTSLLQSNDTTDKQVQNIKLSKLFQTYFTYSTKNIGSEIAADLQLLQNSYVATQPTTADTNYNFRKVDVARVLNQLVLIDNLVSTRYQNINTIAVFIQFSILAIILVLLIILFSNFNTKIANPLNRLTATALLLMPKQKTYSPEKKVSQRKNPDINRINIMLKEVAAQLTTIKEQKEQISEAFRDIKLLSEIGKEIISNLKIEAIAQRVYDNINILMEATIFAIGVYHDEKEIMDFWGIHEKGEPTRIGNDSLNDPNLWAYTCFRDGKEIFINDNDGIKYQKSFANVLFDEIGKNRKSLIYLPLIFNDNRIGLLTVQSYNENAYSKYHLNLLRNLAIYITIAIENSKNYSQISQQKEEIEKKSNEIEAVLHHLEKLVAERTIEIEQQKAEITAQANRLETANKELKKLSIVAEKTDNAIMLMDAEGNILWINDSFTRIYEYTYEQFTTQRGSNIYRTSFNPEIQETLATCVAEKKAVSYEALNITRTGNEIWTQTSLTPILDAQGNIIHLVTIDSDISQRKIAEEEILRQKEHIQQQAANLENINKELKKLSIVAEKTDNAIMLMDAEGNILWINDSFTRIYNYTYEQFIKARGSNILQTSFNPKIKETLAKCLLEKKAVYYEALNVTLDNNEIWTQTTLTPIFDGQENIINLVTVDSDITKIKRAEGKILEQNKNITDSIKYASRIQTAIITPVEQILTTFPESFVFFKPKDIVSGDFYWFKELNIYEEKIYALAVADCTGHGVPGAFVSLLGISFLNEIVSKLHKQGALSASTVLEELRNKVIKSLNNDGKDEYQKDGMDIGFCLINPDKMTIQFAGAYTSLYVVHQADSNHTNAHNVSQFVLDFKTKYLDKRKFDELIGKERLTEIHGTQAPIGIHAKKRNFTEHTIRFRPTDTFYLFSDGYCDQIGGDRNRKFLQRRFKQLLLEMQCFDIQQQGAILHSILEMWMKPSSKHYEQVDDMLVIGFKIMSN